VDQPTKAERQAALERVSAYYESELAKLVERVEKAIARYRTGEIDVHDVDDVIHHYSKAARELWKFCWSRGGGSHTVFIARSIETWKDEAEQLDWWEKAASRRR
jgi:hypothetical protein